ncbi:ketosynthase chain-length factor [Streptomyces oryzae]|uniref:Ketosynthase chain-length factor n=1 Tax=Streptomyces oryzae TaxID=1434886 RepID=A0ABS3X6W0_9ACTN|nr:beta-ketoacyl synthase N-terminal-like domain-containing protein [Streptomyces oryzae]MBO8191114.1 ketosynthase chain-length factor [Streptomyces oryzae]
MPTSTAIDSNRDRPRRAVVTGIGVVNPLGRDAETFWKAVQGRESAVGPVTRCEASGLPVRLAAEIDGFRPTNHNIPRRLAVKSDVFAHYAMAAADEALHDAGLDLERHDRFRTGICFGNNSGGWDLCERGFREYYEQSPAMINPWQATAWFPTAAQGFVSIRYGIRGYSKSVACDRASGGAALRYALRSIQWGHNDIVLAGGAEAPVTRLGLAAHVTTGELTRSQDPETAYAPFSAGRDGLVLGEGGTVLVMEEYEHARQRGARILGELLAVEQRTAAPDDHTGLSDAMTAALTAAGRHPGETDVVFAEGSGSVPGDATEAEALRTVFGTLRIPVTVPKSGYGHQYGANVATEVACALLAARDATLPPTPGTEEADPALGVDLVTSARSARVGLALVNGRSREGTNVAALVGAAD